MTRVKPETGGRRKEEGGRGQWKFVRREFGMRREEGGRRVAEIGSDWRRSIQILECSFEQKGESKDG
jgi:hypothetical protein